MALQAQHNETSFGIGDTVRVIQKIKEGDKERLQAFEGIVIKIKGEDSGKSFTVRRMGAQNIGIERIFPLATPTIERVEMVRSGMRGVRRSKLYYIRDKSTREIESIYARAKRRSEKKDNKVKKTSPKKAASTKKK